MKRPPPHVSAGKDHDIGPLALATVTRIKGRVVDAEGRPIGGAKVALKVYRHVLGYTISSD